MNDEDTAKGPPKPKVSGEYSLGRGSADAPPDRPTSGKIGKPPSVPTGRPTSLPPGASPSKWNAVTDPGTYVISGGGKKVGVVGRYTAIAANALLRLSRLGFSEAKTRGGKALQEFSQRPEHTRQRVYAFGGYGAIVFITLAAQLWEPNSLQAYVKVEPIALPEATVIFVRNDSNKTWKNVRLTLNGRYEYQRPDDLEPSRYISLPVDRFATYGANGKVSYAAKETVPRTVSVECNRGHYEYDSEKDK